MKTYISLIALSLFANIAYSHSGGNRLTCKSARNSGSHQKIEIYLSRGNAPGWVAPDINVTVNGSLITLDTPSEDDNYGTTIHNSPLHFIHVTAEVPYDDKLNTGSFSVMAIPDSVKAFDYENHPVKWKFENEKDECNDSNGRATFKGILRGYLNTKDSEVPLNTQIMDCELTYNSGMAC